MLVVPMTNAEYRTLACIMYIVCIYAIAYETPSIKIGCRCKKEHRRGRSKTEEINVESLYHSMYSILENYFLRNSSEREGKSDPT